MTDPATRVRDAQNHYDVLGVAPAATATAIKVAHRSLASAFHPDRAARPDAHDLMAKVNDAYAVLSDKQTRRMYDIVYNTQTANCPRCGGMGAVLKQKGFTKRVASQCPACGGSGRA